MLSAHLTTFIGMLLVIGTEASAQGCLSQQTSSRRRTSHQNWTRQSEDDKRLTVRWIRDDCELRVDARGDFEVRGDLTGFTRLSDRGYIEIEERDGDRERKVRITNGSQGLQYRWTLDGDDRFDVDRERWLAGVLVELERRTAMFARARIPNLLRQGGPSAVLDETNRMDSDYARRVYYNTLLASTRLDDALLERMLRQAADSMSSDYERAELLRAVARQGAMSDRVTRASIAVAHRMSSDYEKRRSLSAGLESVNTLESRRALFTAAATMSSDFELAELLIAAQRRSLVDSLSADAYFKAVEGIGSAHERRRALSSLLKQRPESPIVLMGLLRASESITSDFELASFLVDFARLVQVRGDLRELYLKATRTIGSDFEYRRALQALVEQDRRT